VSSLPDRARRNRKRFRAAARAADVVIRMAPVPTDSAERAAHAVLANPASLARVSAAGLLSLVLPGLGHLYIGDRTRGVVCMVTIVVTFWTGLAIGGVRATVDPQERTLWFFAQLCSGGNVGAAYILRGDAPKASRTVSSAQVAAWAGPWVSADIGVHYTGVAGLLSVLVILDSMGRAERVSRTSRRGGRDRPWGGA